MSLKFKILSFYVLLFVVGCKNKDKVISREEAYRKPVRQKQNVDTSPQLVDSLESISYKFITGGQSFKKGKVTVLTIEKLNDRVASTGEDLGVQCDNWKLDKNSIQRILTEAQPITGPEWHYQYDIWPCFFFGDVNIDGIVYRYKVNAGAFVTITGDSAYLFGCPGKQFEKYFLSTVWDPDSEK